MKTDRQWQHCPRAFNITIPPTTHATVGQQHHLPSFFSSTHSSKAKSPRSAYVKIISPQHQSKNNLSLHHRVDPLSSIVGIPANHHPPHHPHITLKKTRRHSYHHHHIFPSKSTATTNIKDHVIHCRNGRSREKGDLHRNSPKIPRLHRIDTSSRGRCNRLLRFDDVVVDIRFQRQRRDLERG